MPIEVEFEGKVHEFPDDFTDADIAAALKASAPAKPAAPTGATIRPRNPGILDRAKDAALNASGVPGVLVGAATQGLNAVAQMGDLARAGWNAVAPDSLEVERPAQRIDDIPPMNPYQQVGQRAVQAAEIAGGVKGAATVASKVPGVVARAAGVSKVRAAENLSDAATSAAKVPVDTGKTLDEAQRYRELVARGGRPNTAVNKFVRRVADPDAPPLEFEEARDFYSNLSRISANEYNSLNPTMQRQIIQIREALNEALTSAAGSVGKGEQYAQGMEEYAKAARAAAKWEELKPTLTKTLRRIGYAAAAGAGYQGFSN